jgi:hypothetical protein
MTEAPGRWVVWQVKVSPCCGIYRVHVYPAHLTHIECECGIWIETPQFGPRGKPIHERGMMVN